MGMLLVACSTSQQCASVSLGQICSDNCTCFHTETEVADHTFQLIQSILTSGQPVSALTLQCYLAMVATGLPSFITGMTRQDKIRNEVIRDMAGAKQVLQHIKQQQIKWFGHITCMPINQPDLWAYNTSTLAGEPEEDQENDGATPWQTPSELKGCPFSRPPALLLTDSFFSPRRLPVQAKVKSKGMAQSGNRSTANTEIKPRSADS